MFMFPNFLPMPPPLLQNPQLQMRMQPPPNISAVNTPDFLSAQRPVDLTRIEEMLITREVEAPDEVDLKCRGSWMTSREHMLVLSCQLRSLSATNPYVEVNIFDQHNLYFLLEYF